MAIVRLTDSFGTLSTVSFQRSSARFTAGAWQQAKGCFLRLQSLSFNAAIEAELLYRDRFSASSPSQK
jgi:hypothetical protein